MPKWDANLYLQFGRERTQAAIDLVSRIAVDNPANVIDLGCGPGNSTAILRERWPEAKISGLDSSEEMIALAAESYPEMEWISGNIAEWNPEEEFDVIFSNAALQWVPNHETLFPKLIQYLSSSGVFAAQLPYHHESPLQQVVLEASRDPKWCEQMEPARNALTYETASFYYDVLKPLCDRVDIWETEYFHNMESPQAIVDFIRGSGLRPFVEALDSEEDKHYFETLVLSGYTEAYLCQTDGSILFPFRRQFIIAHRSL